MKYFKSSLLVFLFPFLAHTEELCQPLTNEAIAKPAKLSACYKGSFYSSSVGRDIDFNVIVPTGYSHYGATPLPYAVFLHGNSGDRGQIVSVGILKSMNQNLKKAGQGFLVFAPNGGNHQWMNGALSIQEKYGDLVTKDLIEHIEKNFNVIKDTPCKRALFGISMGGNGVLQLALNNPDIFCTGASISPVFRTPKEISPLHDESKAYGTGKQYEARSVRNLCEKIKSSGSDHCLPYKNFKLMIGPQDSLMADTADTKTLIADLAKWHPDFEIGAKACEASDNNHSSSYWSCELPEVVLWLGEQLKK